MSGQLREEITIESNPILTFERREERFIDPTEGAFTIYLIFKTTRFFKLYSIIKIKEIKIIFVNYYYKTFLITKRLTVENYSCDLKLFLVSGKSIMSQVDS